MLRPDNKRRSKIQERRTAQDFGGLTTPGSGNQWHSKGDVKTPNYLIECKTTSKDSYSLKSATWSKIATEALLEGKDPLMEIEFIDRGVSLVVMDKNDFLAHMRDYHSQLSQELQQELGT